MRYILPLLILLTASCYRQSPPKKEATASNYDAVNPFIGTGGHGHTYPGAVRPFGLIQLSPDTRLTGWDGCSGYHYSDSIIYGFSHTHLSGTGVSDYGDILLMPSWKNAGPAGQYSTTFSHKNEQASPGFYQVELDNGILAKLSVTERCGFHQYQFPKDKKQAYLHLDLEHRDHLLNVQLQQTGPKEVTGMRRSSAWASDQHVYFVLQSEQEIEDIQFQTTKTDSGQGSQNSKALLQFQLKKNKPLQFRIGLSAVSIQGARRNLEKELNHWNFEQLFDSTKAVWAEKLDKIKIRGGTENQRQIFYSALYHNYIVPNVFNDVDGQYRGMDQQIHQADHNVYTIFSLWDTYRATHPLYTILEQETSNDFIKTMLLHYQQGGKLPVWELAGNETNCMIGYHSVSAIADAYQKGIRGFDETLALRAMQHSALSDEAGKKAIQQKGFIALEDEPESVSKTLEYAYDNWCIAQMAKAMNQDSVYQQMIGLAQAYQNVYDPQTGFMRGRFNGSWASPFYPQEVNFNYTEANAWQYSLYVPQDISGLMQLMGGAKELEGYLDRLFAASSEITGTQQADITGMIGQYAHGNEPSHHKAYLYNFVGQPQKTQARVREIMAKFYKNSPNGLSGNEDCGQMSAWYIFSAMGFYPVTPGADYYVIGSPLFDTVQIALENKKTFTIIAQNNSKKNKYIQKVTLNGKEHPFSYLSHQAILEGGTLIFEMGSQASDWAKKEAHWPQTNIPEADQVPISPYFKTSNQVFTDSLYISLACANDTLEIYFWEGDEEGYENAQLYKDSILIKENTQLFAYTQSKNDKKSGLVKAVYHKIDSNLKILELTDYPERYAAGGKTTLIDGLRGGNDFRSGFWQGYQGEDLRVTVDLGELKTINYIALSCLQDQGSWVWFPRSVRFEISEDGEQYREVGLAENSYPDQTNQSLTQKLGVRLRRQARYIRITAKSIGKCPEWHPGAGGEAWIFADELIIE